jgi:hypothetical protein
MAPNTTIPKSLVEQILDDMFASLDAREEFDVPTVRGLRDLARRGDLKKTAQVTKVLEAAERSVDETNA